jgi:hypothetical protein
MVKIKIKTNLSLSRNLNEEEQKYYNQIELIDVLNFTLIDNQVVTIRGTEFEHTNDWRVFENKLLLKEIFHNEYFFIESLLYMIDNFFNPLNIKLNGTIRGFDEYFDVFFSYKVIESKIYLEYEINESIYTIDNIEELMEQFDLSD